MIKKDPNANSDESRFAKLDACQIHNLKDDRCDTQEEHNFHSAESTAIPRLTFRFRVSPVNGWTIQPAPVVQQQSYNKSAEGGDGKAATRFQRRLSVIPTRDKTCTQWLDEYDDFFFESDV